MLKNLAELMHDVSSASAPINIGNLLTETSNFQTKNLIKCNAFIPKFSKQQKILMDNVLKVYKMVFRFFLDIKLMKNKTFKRRILCNAFI